MDWSQISAQWTQLKGRLREQWGQLTDDELEVIAGNREKLIGKLQEKHGLTKDEVERQLEEWQKYVKL
jgi:uncharacterized protein YjbJ (UPF0337 family)